MSNDVLAPELSVSVVTFLHIHVMHAPFADEWFRLCRPDDAALRHPHMLNLLPLAFSKLVPSKCRPSLINSSSENEILPSCAFRSSAIVSSLSRARCTPPSPPMCASRMRHELEGGWDLLQGPSHALRGLTSRTCIFLGRAHAWPCCTFLPYLKLGTRRRVPLLPYKKKKKRTYARARALPSEVQDNKNYFIPSNACTKNNDSFICSSHYFYNSYFLFACAWRSRAICSCV